MFLSASPQLSYFGLRSFDPSVPLQRPGLTVSLPSNTTHYTFSQLHPGVTYQLTIRASTSKGFGLAATLNVTTNISGGGGCSNSSNNDIVVEQLADPHAPLFSPDHRWIRRVWGVSERNYNHHYCPAEACSGQGSSDKVNIITDVCHTQGLVATQSTCFLSVIVFLCSVYSAYQIVVEEVNPQRARRQASSDCFQVISFNKPKI